MNGYPPFPYWYPAPGPYYPPPIMPSPGQTAPQMPVENMTPRQIKKAIRFHQKLIETYESEKKKKEDGKKKDDPKKANLTTIQWMAFLIATSPILGLTYLKLMASLAASIPH